jgi:primosomal protein N' (replication factor Y)
MDKAFDYEVPPGMEGVGTGSVVRISLNGRKVDGWVVATGTHGTEGFDSVGIDRLTPVLAVAALAVDPVVTDLSEWVARRWCGPRRSVLRSATPVRKRSRIAHPSRGRPRPPDDAVSAAARALLGAGGGLLMVPPLGSAISAVMAAASSGTVLMVCPTMRMARLGAAHLRRRGYTTAELPDEIDAALAGRDVVVGSRSAVLAPCEGLGAIVIIDEHEESLHEERVPTWWAPEVALERGRRAGVPVILTSAVPSARSEMMLGRATAAQDGGWPQVTLVDLSEVPVGGSLLTSEAIETVRNSGGRSLLVLNTKGTGRLMVCRRCRAVVACNGCGSAVTVNGGMAECARCATVSAAVCGECGGTALLNVRPGTARLAADLSSATGANVAEVSSGNDDIDGTADAWVGTDALLHRVRDAACVVFLDVDRDLAAPRSSATRELLASVARAARTVGRDGRLVVQTRQPGHPLLVALAEGRLREWLDDDTSLRARLGLPPFTETAVITAEDPLDESTVPSVVGVDWALTDGVLSVRAADDSTLAVFVDALRASTAGRLRVSVNPPRV